MDVREELPTQQDDLLDGTKQKQFPDNGSDVDATVQPESHEEGEHQCSVLLWEMLAKQFLEYEQAAPFLIPEEQQRRLLDFLPHFLKVCSLLIFCTNSGLNLCCHAHRAVIIVAL